MSLKHLILAIVAQTPSSGYDIAQEFDSVSSYFWKATHQQIYRELASLTEEGWVRFKTVEQAGKPDKKIYSITPAGKKAFAMWFAEPLPAQRNSDPLMIKFFAAELGGVDGLRTQLNAARASHATHLAALEMVERTHYAEPIADMPLWKRALYMTLKYGLARERTWLEWAAMCDDVLALP